jgi:signal transduction histidine kinase
MGMGLWIAKQAAELLGGKIWFKSEESKGTAFFIELPLKSKPVKGMKQLT